MDNRQNFIIQIMAYCILGFLGGGWGPLRTGLSLVSSYGCCMAPRIVWFLMAVFSRLGSYWASSTLGGSFMAFPLSWMILTRVIPPSSSVKRHRQ